MSHDKIREEFDAWAKDGRDAGMERGHGDVVRQVIAAMEIAPGERILDLGCGNGWATRLLAQTNAGVQAIGIDVSPQMIMRADALHSFTIRARYDLGQFENLEFEGGEFARVFSMEALYYSPDLDAALSEAFRVLQPGGRADVLIDRFKEAPSTEGWSKALGLDMQWLGEEEWRLAFQRAGFTEVETRRVIDSRGPGEEADFTPSEGSYPSWESRVQAFAAGTLWIHAVKPA